MKLNLLNMLLKSALLILFISSVNAEEPRFFTPEAPSVAAQSYILMDFNSGSILASNNEDERRSPASLTKLMTSYVIFKKLKEEFITLDEEVKISEKAWRTGGSKSFIEVGKMISLEDLLKGMIIQSGNDASVALAEHVAGSEGTFVLFMNDYAQQIGMKNSNFENASGLPHENQYTSAKDMALLSSAMIREFPNYYKWYSQKEFTYNNITQTNRNKLLFTDSTVDGLKTGWTEKAGYCLVTSANRVGMRLISVLMGSDSPSIRTAETEKLLDYGFRFFETQSVNDISHQVPIYKSKQANIKVGVSDTSFLTLPRNQFKYTTQTINLSGDLVAPVIQGDQVGTLVISFRNEDIATLPLIALEDSISGGFFTKMIDTIKLMFR
jgi:D-alanyl-D-alanine carboxypeptidase (penicillin-binding protein 5/6)